MGDSIDGAAYQQALLKGFLSGVGGHGVSGLRSRFIREVAETSDAPAHQVIGLSRLFGEWLEPSIFVLTCGLGTQSLGAKDAHGLDRFELTTWVDDIALAPARAEGLDVSLALSALGRLIHDAAKGGDSRWSLGDTLSFSEEQGIGGWRRFLLAHMTRPIVTGVGPVDVVRVLPIDEQEAADLRATPDALRGFGFVIRCENQGFEAVLARWRTPPPPAPARRAERQVLRAARVEYEGAGDTLRVFSHERAWSANAMRDARLGLDADGFLVAIDLVCDAGPRAIVALGPSARIVGEKQARVLQMDDGGLLITMGAKRVRGDEQSPYVPWLRRDPAS